MAEAVKPLQPVKHLKESRVLRLWQTCPGRNDLETVEEGPIKVLYPGRLNDGSGADFRDAVIATNHGLLTGDIEVHTKSSCWRAHGHHLDPVYNRVVLHVVYKRDIAGPIKLQNGRDVPTLTLDTLFPRGGKHTFPKAPSARCIGEALDLHTLSTILDNAGEQRFQARAAGFQAASSPEEAGQALYRGIMVALGYSRNKVPMAELAFRMSLAKLESAVTEDMPDAECLAVYQALLLGTSGLLPSRGFPGLHEKEYGIKVPERLPETLNEMVTMSAHDWSFFRVRPCNSPARRITAMSHLLLRYRKTGLLAGLVDIVEKTPPEAGHRELEKALMVDGNGFSGALLGADRAANIALNVLLPFALAWGRTNSRPAMSEKAVRLYRSYPAAVSNSIERHMCGQFGIDRKTVNSAVRQQGLLHIFKSFCSVGGCRHCPVKSSLTGTR
jgi:hypothetical protein